MLKLKELKIIESKDELKAILDGKVLINTINAHSYNTAQKDELFAEALKNGDYLFLTVQVSSWRAGGSMPSLSQREG